MLQSISKTKCLAPALQSKSTKFRRYSTAPKRDWRVLFFGTGQVALASAKLLQSRKDLISRFELVCPPQKESKKPLPTQIWAHKLGLTVHEYNTPQKVISKLESSNTSSEVPVEKPNNDNLIELARNEFDIGIVVDFGYMLPSNLISAFKHSPLLMHPSLLPQYRGAAPIEHAIMNGDIESGVTVLDVAPSKFDAGAIFLSRSCPIDPRAPGSEIRVQLAELGAHSLVEVLEKYDELYKTKFPQPLECTKAPKLKPSDYFITWSNTDPKRVYNQWRAFGPLTTTLYGCQHMNTKTAAGTINVILHEFAHPDDAKPSRSLDLTNKSGSLILDKPQNLIWIKTGTDWVAVKSLQMESGRRIIDPISFANGIQLSKNQAQYVE